MHQVLKSYLLKGSSIYGLTTVCIYKGHCMTYILIIFHLDSLEKFLEFQ